MGRWEDRWWELVDILLCWRLFFQCIREVTAKSENTEECLGSLQIKEKK